MSFANRRQFLALPWAAALAAAQMDEYDPSNIKLSHRMPIRSMTDDDLKFLQQMGIRWCRIEFGEQATFDYMKSTVERLARFNMKIYSAVHYCYRRTRCQLGQPGRDQDIEEFNRFLVDCGRLDIPVTNIDWHPANTYTTAEVMTRAATRRGSSSWTTSARRWKSRLRPRVLRRRHLDHLYLLHQGRAAGGGES
jgi:hypothetical protein